MSSDDYEIRQHDADEFRKIVTNPLRTAKDHCHWHGVIRRRRTAKLLEYVLDAAVRMAYAMEGILARGDE